MEPRTEDQLFQDFRRTGDPAPLAEVFDRTAPELLRIALHLIGDAARAEDLVQATFVAAIESAATFDPARQLLPWLAGILTNRARELRRKEARAVDPERLARPGGGDDPVSRAQDTELRSRLDEAIRTVPDIYQPVLVLYLKHGFNSAQIADALRRPPGTVRSQLLRGLELLRKLLPAGLAISALGGVTTARGLAAVRSEVLASAAPAGKSAAVTGLVSLAGAGSVLVMKKAVFSVAVVVAAACWFAWPDADSSPAVTRDDPVQTVSPAVARPASSIAARREVASAPDSLPATKPASLAFVRGRCVAAESGAPLSGCVVKFDGRESGSRVSWNGPVVWTDPEPVTTGADGRFEVAFEPPPTYQHSLDIQRNGRVPRTARWGTFKPGQVDDLGDIAFSPGVEVRGRVVDTDGVPVPKVGVLLKDLPLRIRAGDAANNNRVGWSDDAGLFKITVPIPPGTWPIGVPNSDLQLVRPRSVTVNEGGADDFTVVVRRRPSLAGIVVDETGNPVEREYLWALITRGATSMASAWTRKDGTFTIFCTSEDTSPVRLATMPGAYEARQDERFFEWGTKDIRIVLRRTLSFELTVVEELTEKPVEEFAVVCGPRERGFSMGDARLAGTHPGGRVTVDRVPRGKNCITIVPKDPALASNRRQEIEIADGGIAPLRIALHRLTPLHVRLVTRSGEPAAGSQLQLLEPLGEPVTLGSMAPDDRFGGAYFPAPEDHGDRQYPPRMLSKDETDRDGRAVLFGRAGTSGLYLRALGPGHMPFLRAGIAIHEGAPPLELEAPVASSIHGTLSPAALVLMQPSLVVRQAGEKGFYPSQTSRFAVKPDGSFAIEELCAGAWEVLLLLEVQGAMRIRIGMADTRLDLLQTVTLGGGESARVLLDGSRLAPGRVHGQALLDGAPPTSARAMLRGRSGDSSWTSGPFALDADGRFRAERLIPGTYRVLVQPDTAAVAFAPANACSKIFEVTPAGEVERVFHLQKLKSLRIRILEPDGKTPARHVICSVAVDDISADRPTDADGWLVVDAPGDAEVRIGCHGRRDAAGPFSVADAPAAIVLAR